MLIRMVKADVNEGLCGNPSECPVALAIRNALKIRIYDAKNVIVGRNGIRVLNVRYRTPVRVRKFIDLFDMGESVKPIAFHLRRA